jgi:hypothetical protein
VGIPRTITRLAFRFEPEAVGIACVRVDSRGEIEVLERVLASVRERAARGDAGAHRIVIVVEQMIAEREQQLGVDIESRPPTDV